MSPYGENMARERDVAPNIHRTCYVAPNATIIGKVILGKESSVWPGAVIRGDENTIVIGERSNVQDNCVLHVDETYGITIGNEVSIGHCAMVHGASIGDRTIIGINATVLEGVRIGKGCIIGANAMVKAGMEVPDYSLVLGVPATIVRSGDRDLWERTKKNCDDYVRLRQEHRDGRHIWYRPPRNERYHE